jgi:transposase
MGEAGVVRAGGQWGARAIGERCGMVKVAAPTVWEILHEAGIDPAPERRSTTWGQPNAIPRHPQGSHDCPRIP